MSYAAHQIPTLANASDPDIVSKLRIVYLWVIRGDSRTVGRIHGVRKDWKRTGDLAEAEIGLQRCQVRDDMGEGCFINRFIRASEVPSVQ